jgi:hypothetical protein
MPALVTGVHALKRSWQVKHVDGRDKPGHDALVMGSRLFPDFAGAPPGYIDRAALLRQQPVEHQIKEPVEIGLQVERPAVAEHHQPQIHQRDRRDDRLW